MEKLFTFYEVGGCVRDSLLGLKSKDVDFSVVPRVGAFPDVTSAYNALVRDLQEQGFRIFLETPEFQTVRAQVPKGHPLRQRVKDADFVLAREDGPYSDGRRPDYVLPGTLEDDIFRRDFTVNALARTVEGELVDLVGGLADLEARQLRFVGDPLERISEDGLRVLRGFRFSVTKGFSFERGTREVLWSSFAAKMLAGVHVNRVREELEKMLQADTLGSLGLFAALPAETLAAIFRDGLRLFPSLKE